MGDCYDRHRFPFTLIRNFVWSDCGKFIQLIDFSIQIFLNLKFVFQLVSRKKASKKKAPANHLTADMLNELNKNHMGGLENYGADDFYNLDDTWNDERRHQDLKHDVKAKV